MEPRFPGPLGLSSHQSTLYTMQARHNTKYRCCNSSKMVRRPQAEGERRSGRELSVVEPRGESRGNSLHRGDPFTVGTETSRWPKAWKLNSVFSVHKRNAKNEAKKYRPVSLQPSLSKVLECVVASRVSRYLEHHHLLSTRHNNFKQGKSAADLHLLLVSEWNTSLDQGKTTGVVALDIEGVFGRVWYTAPLSKLRSAGVERPLL
ncbi:hypothetical protein O3P69_014447 [Scylla paramamosain]|uniref:Reverse transcriptase domain-containing protein n=1 Tax=Scylla paramamosain TaxID=85552 RepID=A0AAW0TB55_SCYPA